MGDIFVPPILQQANSVLDLAGSLQKLLDPVERKKIADDIVEFHALNVTEAKKAEDARALISQHADILSETKKITEQNAWDAKQLNQDKAIFSSQMDAARAKVAAASDEAATAAEGAQELHDHASKLLEEAAAKETALYAAKAEHEANVAKFAEDQKALDKKRADIDEYKKQVLALDAETKAKVEKLKQFNF